MSSYCVKCKKNTATSNITHKVAKNGRNMEQGICSTCGAKKTKFISGTSASKKGGFLPLLAIPGLIAAAKLGLAAAATGAATAAGSHLYKKATGTGLYLNPNRGRGMYLNPNRGRGMYLNPNRGRRC